MTSVRRELEPAEVEFELGAARSRSPCIDHRHREMLSCARSTRTSSTALHDQEIFSVASISTCFGFLNGAHNESSPRIVLLTLDPVGNTDPDQSHFGEKALSLGALDVFLSLSWPPR